MLSCKQQEQPQGLEADKSRWTHPAGTVPSSSLEESRADRWWSRTQGMNETHVPGAFSSQSLHH